MASSWATDAARVPGPRSVWPDGYCICGDSLSSETRRHERIPCPLHKKVRGGPDSPAGRGLLHFWLSHGPLLAACVALHAAASRIRLSVVFQSLIGQEHRVMTSASRTIRFPVLLSYLASIVLNPTGKPSNWRPDKSALTTVVVGALSKRCDRREGLRFFLAGLIDGL